MYHHPDCFPRDLLCEGLKSVVLLTPYYRQFPQNTLPTSANTPASRKAAALKYISGLTVGDLDLSKARQVAAFDPLVHVFTHIRLTMYCHHFRINCNDVDEVESVLSGSPARKWVQAASMDEETLSTGMRKCWDLVAG